jgi:hypothetical protein
MVFLSRQKINILSRRTANISAAAKGQKAGFGGASSISSYSSTAEN